MFSQSLRITSYRQTNEQCLLVMHMQQRSGFASSQPVLSHSIHAQAAGTVIGHAHVPQPCQQGRWRVCEHADVPRIPHNLRQGPCHKSEADTDITLDLQRRKTNMLISILDRSMPSNSIANAGIGHQSICLQSSSQNRHDDCSTIINHNQSSAGQAYGNCTSGCCSAGLQSP